MKKYWPIILDEMWHQEMCSIFNAGFLLMRKPDRVSNTSNQCAGHVVFVPSPRNVTEPLLS
jgi:hypothetical protein